MTKRKRGRPYPKPALAANTSDLVARRNLAGLGGQHFAGDRDLWETFGYPQHIDLPKYRTMYERGDIAGRLIDAYPDATWREEPTIKGVDLTAVGKRFKLWSVLQRLDRLCQLGTYGVLLLGLDGGETMSEPATQSNYKLLYLQPHGEQTAQVGKWNDDPSSPRFNKPEIYNIQTGLGGTNTGRTLAVHWTRVIHIAEDALEHECIGQPRLQRVFNRLMDLEKLLGGSAEMYWQNVAMMLAFIADKETTFDADDAAAMATQLDEMQHGLRRMLRLRGVKAEQLAPGLQGSSPGEHIDKQLDMIAGASGIPKRILIGNEAGELASSQDENAWSARVAERRQQFAGPTVLEPFITRGLAQGWLTGALEEIEWPESDTLGEQGRADVLLKTAQAVATYGNTMSDPVVTPDEMRAIAGYDPLPQLPPEEPLDETDPDVQDAFAKVEEPAAQALNGAQIQAIKQIVETVAAGQLPKEAGEQLVRIAFPFLAERNVTELFSKIIPGSVPPDVPPTL